MEDRLSGVRSGIREEGEGICLRYGLRQVCRSGADYRGPLRQDRAAGLLRDELSEFRPSPQECSHTIGDARVDGPKLP